MHKFNNLNRNKKFSKKPGSGNAKPEYQFDHFLSDVGNREISGLFNDKQIQAKPEISEPGDRFEREADNTADRILRSPASDSNNMTSEDIIAHSRKAQEKSMGPLFGDAGLSAANNNGESMDRKTIEYFQPHFGIDLGNVRIHKGQEANLLARAARAKAFAYGNNIVFSNNRYQPDTAAGKTLLAHELAHVEQQNGTGNGKNIIRRWPAETKEEPTKEIKAHLKAGYQFKCHDAVIIWLLRSSGRSKADAFALLARMQEAPRGPSMNWIKDALGYNTDHRVTDPATIADGDILFIGNANVAGVLQNVAHSMVYVGKGKIRGFNNFGTFGSKGSGDAFSTEKIGKPEYWKNIKKLDTTDLSGKARYIDTGEIGIGAFEANPIYKISYAEASANLTAWIATIT
jgi:hypothetical protein